MLNKLIQTRKPLHHDALPFVLMWSQKAGCTAILRWFLYHANELAIAEQYQSEGDGLDIHDYERNVLKKRTGYDDELVKKLTAGTSSIQFLRCPYARAFSSYTHIHSRFFIRFTQEGKTTPGMEVRKAILRQLYGSDECIEYTFSFLDYLQWLHKQQIDSIEIHHRPQITAIHTIVEPRYYRLEDFDAAAASIEREFGLSSSARQNTSFTAGHHIPKKTVPDPVALKLLTTGIPLSRSPAFAIPKVDRHMLIGTVFGDLIQDIFGRDIAVYDSIAPL
jgi:hypothetical protein